MAANHGRQAIPTKLSEAQFEQFVLPHLSRGRRGPPPTLLLQTMFNYVLKVRISAIVISLEGGVARWIDYSESDHDQGESDAAG